MRRWIGFMTVVLLLAIPAAAQNILPMPAAPVADPAPTSAQDVDALVRILQDDTARAALIARLRAEPASEAAGPSAPPPGLAGRVAEHTRDAAEGLFELFSDAGNLLGGVVFMLRTAAAIDPAQVWGAILGVLSVIVASFTVAAIARWGAGRVVRAFDPTASGVGRLRRLTLLLAANLVDALGVVLAWGAGYAFALAFSTTHAIGFGQTLFLNAFLVVELLKVALRAVLAPSFPRLRPVPMADADAVYVYFWSSRLVSILGYGFLFVAPLVYFAGSWAGAQTIRLIAALAATGIVTHVALHNRCRVRDALVRHVAGWQTQTLARIGRAFSAIWHLVVIIYAVAVVVVWLANPDTALPFMLRATVLSVIAVGIGLAIIAVIPRFLFRILRLPKEVRSRLPLLQARFDALVPEILRIGQLVVMTFVVLAIAYSWHLFDVREWIATGWGRQIISQISSALLVLLIGGLVYLAVASWVEYRLNPNYGTVPTARERTLLALFRNAFQIGLVVMLVMLTLSELGVNIAPLIAGAGVLGLAIGFGSQKLVQDIITGVFIQLDNAMNEGEVVTVGGISGLVEKLTIRSVSIRDLNGVVHIIPFSTVDRVANMMRHFSCHLIEIGVAYRENVPEVKAAIQEAFDRLKETEHGEFILEPLEMYGLARFDASALVVMARFKTLPGKHWNAGRAYNEIVKAVFDERGIEIPFPHMTVYMGQDKEGKAPPLHVLAERFADGPDVSRLQPVQANG